MSDHEELKGPGIEAEERAEGRHRTLRLVLSLLLAFAAALALYLLQPSWFNVPATATPTNQPATPTPSPTARPKPPVYPYIGREQRVDNVYITPLGVTYTHGSGATLPNRGDVFAIVMLRFVNHSGHDFTLVPNVNCSLPYCNFYVSDSLGEKNPPVPYDPEHTHLRAVVLQDGGRQQGSYTFEVPEHDVKAHTLQLLYFHDPVLDAGSVRHWLLTWPPKHGQ